MPEVGDVLRLKSSGETAIYIGGDDYVWRFGAKKQLAAGIAYDVVGHDDTVPALLRTLDTIREQFMLTVSIFADIFDMVGRIKLDEFGELDYETRAELLSKFNESKYFEDVRLLLKLDGLSQMEEACRTTR